MRIISAVVVAMLAASPVAAQSPDVKEVHRIIEADLAARQAARTACTNGKVKFGMTPDQARSCWGKPISINRTVSATRNHEQWVYAGRQYLYFDNGVLTSLQQTR